MSKKPGNVRKCLAVVSALMATAISIALLVYAVIAAFKGDWERALALAALSYVADGRIEKANEILEDE